MHCFSFFFFVIVLLRVSEYISEERDGFLVDPDLNLLHTKRKHAKQGARCAVVDSSSIEKLKFPESSWGFQLENMPLFMKAKINKYNEKNGKRLGSSHHSFPISLKKGKAIMEEEYL